MPHKLKITEACTYWHNGHERRDYSAGQEIETTDDEFAAVALAQGWASKTGKKGVHTSAQTDPAVQEN